MSEISPSGFVGQTKIKGDFKEDKIKMKWFDDFWIINRIDKPSQIGKTEDNLPYQMAREWQNILSNHFYRLGLFCGLPLQFIKRFVRAIYP